MVAHATCDLRILAEECNQTNLDILGLCASTNTVTVRLISTFLNYYFYLKSASGPFVRSFTVKMM